MLGSRWLSTCFTIDTEHVLVNYLKGKNLKRCSASDLHRMVIQQIAQIACPEQRAIELTYANRTDWQAIEQWHRL